MTRSLYAAALGLVLTGSAFAQDPASAPAAGRAFPDLTMIYTASGAANIGNLHRQGTATVISCTNFHTRAQQIRILVLSPTGTIPANFTSQIQRYQTLTAATKDTVAFTEQAYLNPGIVAQGSLIIEASTPYVSCSAMVVDAAAAGANGIALHMVRHDAAAGTQE